MTLLKPDATIILLFKWCYFQRTPKHHLRKIARFQSDFWPWRLMWPHLHLSISSWSKRWLPSPTAATGTFKVAAWWPLGFPGSSAGKEPAAVQQTPVWFLGRKDFPGEKTGCPLQASWDSLVVQRVTNLPAMWERGSTPRLGRSLEEGMMTHSIIPAWSIPMDRAAWEGCSRGGHKELMRPQLSSRAPPSTRWPGQCSTTALALPFKIIYLVTLTFILFRKYIANLCGDGR